MLNVCRYPLKATRIAVLGVSYKRNVDDPRESPFYEIQSLLARKGAGLNVFDSWYTAENTVNSVPEAIENARAIVIVTEHSDIIDSLKSIDIAASPIEVIVDGRNCLDADLLNHWGVLYRGIGRRAVTDYRN